MLESWLQRQNSERTQPQKTKMKKVISNVIMSYLIAATDFIGGFEAHFNVIDWNSKRIINFVAVFVIASIIDFFIQRYRKE